MGGVGRYCLFSPSRIFLYPLLEISPIFLIAVRRVPSGCLFDLEDGGVGLHDGHDDFVNIVLEPVVDLLLLVNGLHQLETERSRSEGKADSECGSRLLSSTYLCARHRVDLCSQGVREGCRHQILCSLDAQVDNLAV